jgi:hypothetical protein
VSGWIGVDLNAGAGLPWRSAQSLFLFRLDLREWRCVQDEGVPPPVYCHEPSEDEARPSLKWMLGGHHSCNIE